MTNSQDSQGPASLLYLSFLRQRSAGGRVSFKEFCAAHAAHAEALRELHSAQLFLEQAQGRVHGADDSVLRADGPTLTFLRRLQQRPTSDSRYEVGPLLGRGGFGEVLRVRDSDLERSLAMKVMRPASSFGVANELDLDALARFLAEAQITGQLDHPGVVPIHEVGVRENGQPYYTMREVQGSHLHDVFEQFHLGRQGRTLVACVEMLLRVCETMAFAHSKRVVHRDLKPSNVMVGEFGEVYVMDWGLARSMDDASSPPVASAGIRSVRRSELEESPGSPLRTQGAPGTPEYMPPERAGGVGTPDDPRGDIYSVGAMLYELLAGQAPYRRKGEPLPAAPERFARVLAGAPVSIESLAPNAPPELIAVCAKAMAREAGARYGSMRELADELRAYLDGRVVRAHRTGAWVEFVKWVGRNKSTAASLAAALVILLGASIAVALQNQALAGANSDKDDANRRLAGSLELERIARAEAERSAGEAVDARADSQRRLAESYLQQARLSVQRGRWRDALTALEQARTEGFPDQVLLEVERARALLAVSDKSAAQTLLESLMLRDDLGGRRGEVLLLRANLLMSDDKQNKRALELVEQARHAGLAPAQELFARAIGANTMPEALSLLEEVLRLDPYHQQALVYLPMLYLVLGRIDEAVARSRVTEALYPEDPSVPALLATAAALRGDHKEARAILQKLSGILGEAELEAMAALLDSIELVLSQAGLEDWIGAPRTDRDAKNDKEALVKMISKAGRLRRKGGDWSGLELLDPSLPVLRKGHGAWISGVAAGGWTLHLDVRASEANLREAIQVAPEAMLYYLHAALLMELPNEDFGHVADKLAWGEFEYRMACEAPALVPVVRRVAHHWAAYSQLILASSNVIGRNAEMEARAYRTLDWLIEQPDLLAYECGIFMSHLLSRDLNLDVAARLLNRWAQIAPAAPEMLAARAQIRLKQGALAQALQAADELVDVAGASDANCALRDRVLSAIDDFKASH